MYWKGGTVLPAKWTMGTAQINQPHICFNDANIKTTKTKAHTTYTQPAKIGNAAEFWVFVIEVSAVALGTSLTLTDNKPSSGTAIASRSAINDLPLIMQAGTLNLKIATREYGFDNLDQFPSGSGFSGFAGSGFATSAESLVQNGVGIARQLTMGFVIESEDANGTTIEFESPITPANEGQLFVRFRGLTIAKT
jgi:hypothetical protein